MNLSLKDLSEWSFMHTVHTFIHRLSISLSSEPLDSLSFPLGCKNLLSVRPRVIETLSHPWQGRVLPLNHGRVNSTLLIQIDPLQKRSFVF